MSERKRRISANYTERTDSRVSSAASHFRGGEQSAIHLHASFSVGSTLNGAAVVLGEGSENEIEEGVNVLLEDASDVVEACGKLTGLKDVDGVAGLSSLYQ